MVSAVSGLVFLGAEQGRGNKPSSSVLFPFPALISLDDELKVER